jgi:hypothetical protein
MRRAPCGVARSASTPEGSDSGEAHNSVHERTAPTQAALAVMPILWSTGRTAGAREHQPPASFVRTLDSARSSMTPQLGSLRKQCLTERAYKSPPSVRLHYAARSFAHSSAAACRPMDCCPCRPFATWSCAVARAITPIGPMRVLRAGKARRCQCRQNRYVASPSTVLFWQADASAIDGARGLRRLSAAALCFAAGPGHWLAI